MVKIEGMKCLKVFRFVTHRDDKKRTEAKVVTNPIRDYHLCRPSQDNGSFKIVTCYFHIVFLHICIALHVKVILMYVDQ
ncbi:CLUMA_CG005791, isoform A [Clunio marinus]|uniref:CLUMA_CG005791, isoform A n=1 Tax=Clunio marinus TaxID=568069 RepID=A0A1J1HW00_9DIPT|nr:CLUMA_CG005791, isoform A [Clunio marinus]